MTAFSAAQSLKKSRHPNFVEIDIKYVDGRRIYPVELEEQWKLKVGINVSYNFLLKPLRLTENWLMQTNIKSSWQIKLSFTINWEIKLLKILI